MMLLKRLSMMNWLVKKVNNVNAADTSDLVKKGDYDKKIRNLKRKLLTLIMVNTLLLKNLMR